jgi:hypothetical protein
MGEHGTEGEAVQILENTDTFGVGLGSPIAFETLFEPIFDKPVIEKVFVIIHQSGQIVLIHVLIEKENLLIPKMNVFLLEGIGLAKEIGDNSARRLDSLEFITVAIRFSIDI